MAEDNCLDNGQKVNNEATHPGGAPRPDRNRGIKTDANRVVPIFHPVMAIHQTTHIDAARLPIKYRMGQKNSATPIRAATLLNNWAQIRPCLPGAPQVTIWINN